MKGVKSDEESRRIRSHICGSLVLFLAFRFWLCRGGEFRLNPHILITGREMLIPFEVMPEELKEKYERYRDNRDITTFRATYFCIPPDYVHKVLSEMLEYVMSIVIE